MSESYSGDGLIAASFYESDRAIPAIDVSRNYASNSLFGESEFDLAEAYKEVQSLRVEVANLNANVANQAIEIERLNKAVSQKEATISSTGFELAEAYKDATNVNAKSAQQAIEIQRLNQEVSEKEGTIASILGSKSWRATEILRRMSQALKR